MRTASAADSSPLNQQRYTEPPTEGSLVRSVAVSVRVVVSEGSTSTMRQPTTACFSLTAWMAHDTSDAAGAVSCQRTSIKVSEVRSKPTSFASSDAAGPRSPTQTTHATTTTATPTAAAIATTRDRAARAGVRPYLASRSIRVTVAPGGRGRAAARAAAVGDYAGSRLFASERANVQHSLWAATPTPSPTPSFDPNSVTPGVVGFVVTLALIVATIVLLVSMNRRVRRVTYRAEIAERLDAEEAAGAQPDESRE